MTDRLTPDKLAPMNSPANWNQILADILESFGCQTGTIHQAAPGNRILKLVCQIGVPESLMDKISTIPFGKGIAGAAAERGEAVKLCNLQQDLGGVAKIDARQTGVSGSLAVPVFATGTDRVVGTLGIGKMAPHQYSDAEERRLEELAREIAELFRNNEARGD